MELYERAIARSNVYHLLSRVYAIPHDENFLNSLYEWTSSIINSKDFTELPIKRKALEE